MSKYRNRSKLHSICFVIFFIGLHTCAAIYIGGVLIFPFVICFAAALISICSLVIDFINHRPIAFGANSIRMVYFLILCSVVTVASIRTDSIMQSFIGLMQLIYSFFIAGMLAATISKMKLANLSWICMILILILALLSIFEFLGPLRQMSNSVRVFLNPGWVYDNDTRDLLKASSIRSKVFSPEPSLVGVSTFWLTAIVFWCSETLNVKRFVVWLVALSILIFTVRSPILLLTLVLGLSSLVFIKNRHISLARFGPGVTIAAIFVLTATIVGGYLAAEQIFAERIESMAGGDSSTNIRILGPYLFLVDYLPRHLFIGTGVIGNLEMLSGELSDLYKGMGMSWVDKTENLEKTITNVFVIHFLYLGLIPGVGGMYLLIKSTKIENAKMWFFLLVSIFVLWQEMGGYNTCLPWCISFAICSTARKVTRLSRLS